MTMSYDELSYDELLAVSQDANRQLCRALDDADAALRRCMVYMLALGYGYEELTVAYLGIGVIEKLAAVQEAHYPYPELIEGVLG